MGRVLKLLNVALALVALALAGALVKTWLQPAPSYSSPPPGRPSQEVVALALSRPARPPLAHFDLLLERNLFRQPPPRAIPAPPGQPPPPPQPLPTLVGTILVDDEWRAILSDKGKANIYAIGQEVAGGVITEIKADRVLYKRGETTSALPIKALSKSESAHQHAPLVPQAQPMGPAPPRVPANKGGSTPPPIRGLAQRRRARLLHPQGRLPGPAPQAQEALG
jgi:hypothetical protein